MSDQIRVGVIGCGGFGLFALQHFAQVDGIKLVGMAGTHRPAAIAAAKRFGIPDIEDVEKLVNRDDVDLIYISTPPFLHHPQAILALQAGKHVICEKPLAITLEQADEMIELAKKNNLLIVANLMQRYNPIYDKVKQLIDEKILGEVLHGYFENYACDEQLGPDHWFWDKSKSGGIFIEHAVHFFDMFEGWLGEGKVVSAQANVRPGTENVEEQVQCTVKYGDVIHINMYHGFTQAGRMDRQELRLLFERGDITLYEWIPVQAKIRAIANEEQTRRLCEIFEGARLDVTEIYSPHQRKCKARFKEFDVYHKIELTYGLGDKKWHRYGELIRGLVADQIRWIRDKHHKRKITERNGRNSLAMAIEAERLAHKVDSHR